MTDFSRYRCWETAVAAATLTTEAVSPSPAVFFATHAPLRIYRSPASGRRPDNPGIPVDEEEVRNDFLTRPTANGILLMPVIGQSGTGKSHLVRWIKEKTPSTRDRQVIYLPKTRTSLKAVVKALLAEVEDGELDQLKADVDRMSTELDQAGTGTAPAQPPARGPGRGRAAPWSRPACSRDRTGSPCCSSILMSATICSGPAPSSRAWRPACSPTGAKATPNGR